MTDQLLTVADVAELLKVSESQVRTMARRGVWPHLRLGGLIRFSQKHLARIIREAEAKDVPPEVGAVQGSHFRIRRPSSPVPEGSPS